MYTWGERETDCVCTPKVDIKCFSQSLSILVFETRTLTEPGVDQVDQFS